MRCVERRGLRSAGLDGFHDQGIEIAGRDLRLCGVLLDHTGGENAKQVRNCLGGCPGSRFDALQQGDQLLNEWRHDGTSSHWTQSVQACTEFHAASSIRVYALR